MSLKDAHFHQITTADGTIAGTPLADQFDSNIDTDVVCMSKYNKCYFLMYIGAVSSTPTQTLTVIPCNDADASATNTAIPFRYKIVTSPDTNSVWTASSSLLTTTGASQIYVIEVNADDLPVVSGVKYEYIYMHIVETAGDGCLAGVIIIMDEPRYAEDVTDTVTA